MRQLFFIFISLLGSYGLQKVSPRTDLDNSIIITRINYRSHGMVGFGGSLIIRNTKTNQLYQGQSKKGFNPFVIVPNVPPGTYSVDYFTIISGSNKIMIHDTTYFNKIVFDKPSIYFLGNYFSEKIPPLLKYVIKISLRLEIEDIKIYKEIHENSKSWMDLKINNEIKLFKNDSTIIEIQNRR
jgi:hypothetical protein